LKRNKSSPKSLIELFILKVKSWQGILIKLPLILDAKTLIPSILLVRFLTPASKNASLNRMSMVIVDLDFSISVPN